MPADGGAAQSCAVLVATCPTAEPAAEQPEREQQRATVGSLQQMAEWVPTYLYLPTYLPTYLYVVWGKRMVMRMMSEE